MKRFIPVILAALVLTAGGASALAFSSGSEGEKFDVSVTNLTRGQQFTPILVVSHEKGVNLFTLGEAASGALATLAETGNTGPLTTLLMEMPGVNDVVTMGPLLGPGASRTITIEGGGKFKHISLASMLIPTNDGFLALNGVKGLTGKTLTFLSPAYDAGSEVNNELCASIPGPACGGSGDVGVPGGGEGFVHVHAGIHGIGDIPLPEDRDWRNPVAQITISEADEDDD